MITEMPITCQSYSDNLPSWQQSLRQAVCDCSELLRLVELSPQQVSHLTNTSFPLRVPRGYIAKMRSGDPNDPLLRQVLPLQVEQTQVAHFNTDPVGDAAAQCLPGLLYKYPGRVLLVSTSACAIHCRFCFRRYYHHSPTIPLRNPAVLTWLSTHTQIKEIILSGGDPLVLPDRLLADFVCAIADIPHIQRLRIHSRLPIVLPERITEDLLSALIHPPLKTMVVVHANHANEIDNAVGNALQAMVKTGITVLNQSVLLKGVNDHAIDLIRLSETLFQYQVLPYYLHLLDRVQGAAHFEVSESTAIQLIAELRKALPGYLVPRLAREIAGLAHKQIVE